MQLGNVNMNLSKQKSDFQHLIKIRMAPPGSEEDVLCFFLIGDTSKSTLVPAL